MADAFDPPQAFHIDVQQIAGMCPLIAGDRRRRLARRQTIQAAAVQHARHRRSRNPQGRTDLPGRRAGVAQGHNRGFRRHTEPARLPVRPRRPIGQLAGAAARQPFGHRPDTHTRGLRRLALRPALLPDAPDEQAALVHIGLGVTMNTHSGDPPETVGWSRNPHCFQSLPNEQRV